jgi:cytochrome c-type biogenesis protein CcmH/NrfF
MTTDTMLWGIVILLIVLAAWAFWQVSVMRTLLRQMPAIVAEDQEERHRQMLTSLADQAVTSAD